MEQTKDIINKEDIKQLVDAFYANVRRDDLLAPIFNERIGDRWPQHLEKMYSFWTTVLLAENDYHGSPFPPHAQLPVDHSHFMRWLELFHQTIDESFQGEKAIEAKWRAVKMAEMFENKIEYYRNQGFKNLI
ncbi:MAG: group III truncated hemoglobin [Chitinophagaceae bacterium]